jgi:methylated-DNA-protein-cysteine methyltransferase-like protein
MSRGDDAAAPPPFHAAVCRVVRRVPRGCVVTYAQVAALAGAPRAARAVGAALGALHGARLDDVPWQRVVAAGGRCSHRDGFWSDVQRELLEAEGVRFGAGGAVDLARYGWCPRGRRRPLSGARARRRGRAAASRPAPRSRPSAR